MKYQSRWIHASLGAIQWFVFLLVYAIPIPIVIGGLYHLSPQEIAGMMQRTFLVAGASSMLQGILGHRLPIADGPAGIWLSVFVILGDMAVRQGLAAADMLRNLEGGMMMAGVFLLLLSGVARRIARWFTPIVTGSFLLLLSLQLGGVFLKGMLDAGGGPLAGSRLGSAALAIAVFAIVFGLSVWGRGSWKSYAVLIGIAAGWLVFGVLGMSGAGAYDVAFFRLPQSFAWGTPQFDLGMAVSILPLGLMLLSSTIAATESMKQVVEAPADADPRQLLRSTAAGGVTHLLSACFSTVGIVPLGGSTGFVHATRQYRMGPFLAGSVIMVILSFIPAAIGFLTRLPAPVAYAVELAAFVPMVGMGIRAFLREEVTDRRLTILGTALLVGMAIMFLPGDLFQHLPAFVQYIAGNGLLVGVLIAMVLERVWKE